MSVTSAEQYTLLVLAPLGQDAPAIAELLRREGIQARTCSNGTDCAQLCAGAGALLLTEEALELPDASSIFDAVKAQPAWSELPLIVLTRGGERRVSSLLDLAASAAGSLTLLERPMSTATLLLSVQVALRSRRRQYEVRELLAELQRQKDELRQSEAQAKIRADELAALMDAAPAVTFVAHDPQCRRMTASRAVRELLGLPPDANLSKSAPEGERPDNFKVLQDGRELPPEELPLQRATASGREVKNAELTLAFDDGAIRTITGTAVPLFTPDGQVRGAIGSFVDITDRKKAEAALRVSADRLQLLSDVAGRLLAAEDPQKIVNELCSEVMRHLGCDVFFNFLAHERSGRLHLNACAGIPDEEAAKIEWLDYGVAVCGCVAQQGCRIVAEDIGEVPDPRTDLVNSYGVRAYACHPLLDGTRVIGTLSFGAKNRGRFTADELALMKAVADHVAVAMQRKQSQEALHVSEEKFAKAFASNPAAVALTRLEDGVFLEVNDTWEKLNGYRRDEILGQSARKLPIWPTADAGKRFVQELQEKGSVHGWEQEFLKKSGESYVAVLSAQILNMQGEKVILSTLVDITDRKRTEEQVRRKAEELERLLEAVPAAVWISHDPECKTIEGNREANRFYEAAEGENVSATARPQVRRFFTPEGRELAASELPMQSAAANNRTVGDSELHVLLPSGRRMVIVGSAVPLRDEKGDVRGCVGAFLDITARKEAEKVLARDKEQLQRLVDERTVKLTELVAELEHFSYTITHDMRAPLRAMQGFSQIISRQYAQRLDDTGQDFLRRIIDASKRMDHLITDALNYSKVVRGEFALESVEPKRLLLGIIESYPQFQVPQAEIQVVGEFPAVRATPAGLTQVFSNLLGNAVKFVEQGKTPRVRVWAEPRGDTVRLWFEDNGIGIPEGQEERIFHLFQRVSKDYEGTGVGLALVRKVVERMRGKVGFESKLGEGSRFWVELAKG